MVILNIFITLKNWKHLFEQIDKINRLKKTDNIKIEKSKKLVWKFINKILITKFEEKNIDKESSNLKEGFNNLKT